MRDIENREDLFMLMEVFYTKLMKDDQVGYIFTEVANLDLSHHLPLLADFWNNALFHTGGYKNNVVQIHKDLNYKEHLTPAHFHRWLAILNETINEHFQGEIADKMKQRANQVGMTIQAKLGHYS